MSRITMESNGLMQNGGSRIPRFDHNSRNTNSNTFNGQQPLPSLGSGQKLSKLEQMQRDYQKNMIKAKEEKIITMYEENQRKALDKVNQKKGHVRDFFNERRTGSGGSHHSTPTMDQLYRQKKEDTQSINSNQGYGGSSRSKPGSNYPNYNRGNLNDKKQSAGRDRANLLAPINRGTADPENPFAKRKAQIVRPRTYKGVQNKRDYPENDKVPRSAPNGLSNGLISDNNTINDEEESPLPSTRQFQHLQQKRKMLQDQRQSNQARAQQQNARKPPPRRNGHYEYETSEEDEGYNDESGSNSTEDDMKKKQQELLAQIEAQQKELERLRNDRVNAEVAEKKEMERRKKLEEERRKKRIEDERRREIAQEEERARLQWEEEKQQKIMMEKQRMRHISQSSHNDSDSNFGNSNYGNSNHGNGYYDRQSTASPESHYNNYEKKQTPAPPPKSKPANTRKPAPKRQPVKPRSPSPLPSGDHTALYENADNMDGAFESVGRLRACFNCGRKFAEDRLQKHETSCKNITKKRKVMDPTKVRTRGTELEQYQGHRQPTPTKVKKNNWRSKHESFMEAIKYAKKASQIEKEGGNLADLPPPPRSENPDYVQCPHCSRKFNESAAERHIPHCKNTKARPKPPPQRRR